MKKIIILGGSQTGLAMARAFGRRGCTVFLVNCYAESVAHCSKYVQESYEVCYNSEESEITLLHFLLKNTMRFENALIIPDNDYSVLLLAKIKNKISHIYSCLVNDYETTAFCIDKKLTYTVANGLNISVPKTFYPEEHRELGEIEGIIGYPCLIKPRRSFLFREQYKKKLIYVENRDELTRSYTELGASNHDVMISEIIPGGDSSLYLYCFYINREHALIGDFMAQKIRQTPPLYGTGGVIKSVEIIPEIKNLSVKLVERIKYTGFGMIEYKYDIRDYTYKIIDFNARPVLFYELFHKACMGFTDMILSDMFDQNVSIPNTYVKGVYWIDLFGDFYYHFLNCRRNNVGIRDFFSPYFKKKAYDSFSIDDVVPFLYHFLSSVKQYIMGKRK
jgi:predicted ATP-grasp superfamily ATP-dependent carboligase